MKTSFIIIIILTIILLISLVFNVAYILQTRHKNNEIKGAYTFNTTQINENINDSNRVDLHLKYIMSKFCKNNKIKGSSKNNINYNLDENLNINTKNIEKLSESFQPDYVIELENRYIIIEFDVHRIYAMKPTRFYFFKIKSQCEGDNFHSDDKNSSYIKKMVKL